MEQIDLDHTGGRLPMTERSPQPAPLTWTQRLALLVSAASSPFVVTAVTVTLVVILLRPTLTEFLLWAAITLVCGAGAPFLFVHHLWRRGRISDLHVAVRRQRALPFAVALLGAAVGVGLLQIVGAPHELVALGVVYLANGLALTLISLRWKISVHTAVLAVGIAAVALLGHPGALYGLLTVPVVLWARVSRGRHTLLQGLLPVLLAALVTPLVYYATLAVLSR